MIMLKLIPTLILLIITLNSYAQNYSINWGDALKIKKGRVDLDIVYADKTGYYFVEKNRWRRIPFRFGW